MKLTRDGRLTIPLYHGTSSLFVESILNRGLGAANPIETLQVLPFLRRVNDMCKALFDESPGHPWLAEREAIESMVQQDVVGGANFRHGGTYLTPSRLTACRYAQSNSYGSEALSTAIRWYEEIRSVDPRLVLDPVLSGSPILDVLGKPRGPVLVEVCDLEVRALRGESGECPEGPLELLEEVGARVGGTALETIGQQCNFELREPVESRRLKLYEIVADGQDPSFPKCELRPLAEAS